MPETKITYKERKEQGRENAESKKSVQEVAPDIFEYILKQLGEKKH